MVRLKHIPLFLQNDRNYGRPTDSKLRQGLWLTHKDIPVEIVNVDLKNNKITVKTGNDFNWHV